MVLLRTAALFVLVLILYIFIAAVFFGVSRLDRRTTSPDQSITIYLVADDFHADVLIPIQPMDPAWDYLLAPSNFSLPRQQIKMLSFGWGSREFYLNMREWNQLSLNLSLKAVAFDDSVMHVTAYRSNGVRADHYMVTPHKINQDGYQKLLAFIHKSHRLGHAGNAIHIPDKGYGVDDTFFVANGQYNPIQTCNQWTGEAFRQAGVAVPLWTPFSHGLKFWKRD